MSNRRGPRRSRPGWPAAHRLRRLAAALAALVVPLLPGYARPQDPYEGAPSLRIVRRTIDQSRVPYEQCRDHQRCWLSWRVDYVLENGGREPLEITPGAVSAEIESVVSNARVPSHGIARPVSHAMERAEPGDGLSLRSTADVVPSKEDTEVCREEATLEIRPLDPTGDGAVPVAATGGPSAPLAVAESFRVEPGRCVEVNLALEHQHFLHGPYEPLLGRRSLTLRVGPATFRDDLPLDRPLGEVYPPCTWGPLPAERLDPRIYVSAPDSIRMAAYVPGQHGYDFPERPVRPDTPMRLSFWYLIAPGLDGKCLAEIKQYRDAPRSCVSLPEARVSVPLGEVGRWVHVERTVRTDPSATTLRLHFRVDSDAGAGEMWIDDVELEPARAMGEGP